MVRADFFCFAQDQRFFVPNRLSWICGGLKLFVFGDVQRAVRKARIAAANFGFDHKTLGVEPASVRLLFLEGFGLPPVNERRLVDTCCELIGPSNWIRDALRKNRCAHLRAVYKNDYDVVKDGGNTEKNLRRHGDFKQGWKIMNH